MRICSAIVGLLLGFGTIALCLAAGAAERHAVPKEHPRLLGSRARLQALAKQRSSDYQRTVTAARKNNPDGHAKMISLSLVCAIENDTALGKQAVQMAMKIVNGRIRKGHTKFAEDLALTAIVYDLCHPHWTDEQRQKFHVYVNKTVDANVRSETSVFHNGWYGYKNWGIGMACYASYYENPRAPEILKTTLSDYRSRAAPALDLAGDGGGWAEGYYVNYWTYEWVFFCEAARFCEGIDLYEMAPKFFRYRAIASMFECYPPIMKYNTRRAVPMGDGGGRIYGGDRDKVLAVRRILVNRYRDDPFHQAVHAFNEITPRVGAPVRAYKDFLWRDPTVRKGDLKRFKLSHISAGPGYVYARSSWDPDAAYFFFKCGDRFTAHQHLDVGNFLIFKHEQLVGDGGHYDSFSTTHCVNYYLRSIAHNTMLVYDPSETWRKYGGRGIRAGNVSGNDGGQHHDFPHHNGSVSDAAVWEKGRKLYDIADILAFEDQGAYLYVAGDCTRAYRAKKVEYFTRQIVYLRPGTFVIFDRVKSKNPSFKKTWLLQAMKVPTGSAPNLIITNGKGRLFVQTLLPRNAQVRLASGSGLYRYDGKSFPVSRDKGVAVECRIEVSPPAPSAVDYFLHVLTATDASVGSVPQATVATRGGQVAVTAGRARITFLTGGVGGSIEIGGKSFELARKVHPGESPKPVARKASPRGSGGKLTVASAPAKPEGPTDAEKATAKKRFAELKRAIIRGVSGGKHKRVFVDMAGRTTRAKIISADDDSARFTASGLEVPLAWHQLTPRRFYGIARKYTDDHKALYEYCWGYGLHEDAQNEKAKGLQ